jgi:hypothetical protein
MVSRWRKPGNCIFRVFRDALPGPGRRRHNVAGVTRTVDSYPPFRAGFCPRSSRGRGKAAGTPDGLAGADADG